MGGSHGFRELPDDRDRAPAGRSLVFGTARDVNGGFARQSGQEPSEGRPSVSGVMDVRVGEHGVAAAPDATAGIGLGSGGRPPSARPALSPSPSGDKRSRSQSKAATARGSSKYRKRPRWLPRRTLPGRRPPNSWLEGLPAGDGTLGIRGGWASRNCTALSGGHGESAGERVEAHRIDRCRGGGCGKGAL